MESATHPFFGFGGVRNDAALIGLAGWNGPGGLGAASDPAAVETTVTKVLGVGNLRRREGGRVALYIFLTLLTVGIFAIVENIVHAVQMGRLRALMASYGGGESGSRDVLLKQLGMDSLAANFTTLVRILGEAKPEVPQNPPSPQNSPSAVSDEDAFAAACESVAIKAYEPIPAALIGGKVRATPAEAIMARIDGLTEGGKVLAFRDCDSFVKLNGVLGFGAELGPYALVGGGDPVGAQEWKIFIILLSTYAVMRLADHKRRREAHAFAIGQIEAKVPGCFDGAQASCFLRERIDHCDDYLENATAALGLAAVDHVKFRAAQAQFPLTQAKNVGLDEGGTIGLEAVTLPAASSGDGEQFSLASLVSAVGGTDSGIALAVDEGSVAVERSKAEDFIAQVNNFRKGAANDLAYAPFRDSDENPIPFKDYYLRTVAMKAFDLEANGRAITNAYDWAKARFARGGG